MRSLLYVLTFLTVIAAAFWAYHENYKTQAALGEAVGVTRQTIIAIEQGRYSPSLETSFRIARHFGVGVEDVFGWEGD